MMPSVPQRIQRVSVLGSAIVVSGVLILAYSLASHHSQDARPTAVAAGQGTTAVESTPTWMTACLHKAGIQFTTPAAGYSPLSDTSTVIAKAQAAHAMFSKLIPTSILAQAQTSSAEAATKDAVSQALANGPVWIEGFTGLQVPDPGGLSMSSGPLRALSPAG